MKKPNFLIPISMFVCLVAFVSCVSIACGVSAQLPTEQVKPVAVAKTAATEKLTVIFSEPIETVLPVTDTMVVCGTVEGLNVRVEAGTQHQAIGLLADGTVVTLTGRTFVPQVWKWYEISSPVAGWISGRYVCEVE